MALCTDVQIQRKKSKLPDSGCVKGEGCVLLLCFPRGHSSSFEHSTFREICCYSRLPQFPPSLHDITSHYYLCSCTFFFHECSFSHNFVNQWASSAGEISRTLKSHNKLSAAVGLKGFFFALILNSFNGNWLNVPVAAGDELPVYFSNFLFPLSHYI